MRKCQKRSIIRQKRPTNTTHFALLFVFQVVHKRALARNFSWLFLFFYFFFQKGVPKGDGAQLASVDCFFSFSFFKKKAFKRAMARSSGKTQAEAQRAAEKASGDGDQW